MNNVGEFGQILTANLGTDASVNVGLEFTLTPQLGQKIVRAEADGVSVGTVDKTTGDTKLLANNYLEYIVKEGDLDTAGVWKKQAGVSISTTEKIIGQPELFSVL